MRRVQNKLRVLYEWSSCLIYARSCWFLAFVRYERQKMSALIDIVLTISRNQDGADILYTRTQFISYRHAYKYLCKRFVLESLDQKTLLRSQRSHPEHACLNPILGEPSRRLSLRFLFSSPLCSSGPSLH